MIAFTERSSLFQKGVEKSGPAQPCMMQCMVIQLEHPIHTIPFGITRVATAREKMTAFVVGVDPTWETRRAAKPVGLNFFSRIVI